MVIGLWFAAGCLPGPDCTVGATRCEGAVLETCSADPAGVLGPVDDPQYVSGSGPAWEKVADCGANLCVATTDDTFCALEATPNAACAHTDLSACDGESSVSCRSGFVVERRRCNSCDPTDGVCDVGTGDACAESGCAGAFQCDAEQFPTCEIACGCPDGASCDACGASWAKAPDGGAGLQWTCVSGLCELHY